MCWSHPFSLSTICTGINLNKRAGMMLKRKIIISALRFFERRTVMTKYVWKRLLLLIPTILGVMFIVYTILSLTPGTPGKLILGQSDAGGN